MRRRHGRRWGRTAAIACSIAAILAAPALVSPLHAEDDDVAEPAADVEGPLKIPDSQIEVVDWRDIDGWANDDHEAAFAALLPSCRALVNSAKSTHDERPMYPALVEVCRRALAVVPLDGPGARGFFEENFRPVRISKLGEKDGFLTGYYEPIVDGSRVPTQEYTTPIYRRPADLIVSGRPNKDGSFPNKARVMRQIGKRKFVPYYERAEIENGVFDGRQLEICWVKDPIDAFFIQIQGSARIRLEDGAVLRINYDAHNGHPYTPIGRILIERKILTKDEVSMERLRQWMNANPDEGREVRRKNKSFVFFRITQLADHEEATGAQGVPLTAGRSIAVDKALHVYGTPFFIEADLPIASAQSTTKFRRLMMAQDTGSAIVGPARADIYFGAGEEAARFASGIKHNARFTMLIPRDVDPVDAGAKFPLPPRQPGTPEPPPLAAPVAPTMAAPAAVIPLPLPRPGDAPNVMLITAQKPVAAAEAKPALAAAPDSKPVALVEPRRAPAIESKPVVPPAPTALERKLSAMMDEIRTGAAARVRQLRQKGTRPSKSEMAEEGRDNAARAPATPMIRARPKLAAGAAPQLAARAAAPKPAAQAAGAAARARPPL